MTEIGYNDLEGTCRGVACSAEVQLDAFLRALLRASIAPSDAALEAYKLAELLAVEETNAVPEEPLSPVDVKMQAAVMVEQSAMRVGIHASQLEKMYMQSVMDKRG